MAPTENGNGKLNGKTGHLVTGSSAAATAMFAQWLVFSQPLNEKVNTEKSDRIAEVSKINARLDADDKAEGGYADAGRLDRVHTQVTDGAERLTKLEAANLRIETQLGSASKVVTSHAQELWREVVRLWGKQGETVPMPNNWPTFGSHE